MERRRSSYASVAAGTAGSSAGQTPPARAGAFAHMLAQNAPPSSSLSQLPESTDPPSQRLASAHHHPSSEIVEPTGTSAPTSWGKSTAVPAHWNQERYPDGMGSSGSGSSMFIRPSYLRGSRYMERLEVAYREKLAAQREASAANGLGGAPGGTTSLSTSSSSVSLHRMAPSHRGMTYEIVENRPPGHLGGVDEDGDIRSTVAPLPLRWAEVDRHGGLEVQFETGGQDIKYVGNAKTLEHEAAAARTDHPMPPECGIYYYEVTVVSKGKDGYGALERCAEILRTHTIAE